MLQIFTESLPDVIQLTWDSAKFYMFWHVIHYASSNIYAYFCAHISWTGFWSSSALSQAPHCRGANWLKGLSLKTLDSHWAYGLTWIAAKLVGTFGGVRASIIK